MWSRFDDQITHHPKIVKAGIRAAYFFFAGIIYCSRYRTDGYIPKEALPLLAPMGDYKRLARMLVEVRVPSSAHGLWEEVEGGYRVHDFLVYQPSAAAMAQREETDRKRLRAVRSASRDQAGEVGASSDGGDAQVEDDPQDRSDRARIEGAADEATAAPASAIAAPSEPVRRSDVAATSRRRRPVPSPSPSPIPIPDRSQDHKPVCAPDPRVDAREQPDTHTEGRVERSDEAPADVAASASSCDATARGVLTHLAAMPPPICHLASLKYAERFASARLAGLAVDDIRRAITSAGLKLGVHATATPDVPQSLVGLADHVGRFVANQTPATAPSAARPDVEPEAVERFLRQWSALYAKAEGSVYVPTDEDRGHAAEVVAVARQVAREQHSRARGDAGAFEASVTAHWMRTYLRDDGVNGYLAKARHPLRYLVRGLPTYGLPRSPRGEPTEDISKTAEAAPALSGTELAARGRQFLRVLEKGPGVARAVARADEVPILATAE